MYSNNFEDFLFLRKIRPITYKSLRRVFCFVSNIFSVYTISIDGQKKICVCVRERERERERSVAKRKKAMIEVETFQPSPTEEGNSEMLKMDRLHS